MQKIRKILKAVSEKTALPTNQSTNYYQQHQFYRTWPTPAQQSKLGKYRDDSIYFWNTDRHKRNVNQPNLGNTLLNNHDTYSQQTFNDSSENYQSWNLASQPAFMCLKLTIEQGVKHGQS